LVNVDIIREDGDKVKPAKNLCGGFLRSMHGGTHKKAEGLFDEKGHAPGRLFFAQKSDQNPQHQISNGFMADGVSMPAACKA